MLLTQLPPDALLLIFVFIGATMRAIQNENINPWHGLKTASASAGLALLLVLGVCDYYQYAITLWPACVGGGIAYFGNFIIAALDRYGKRVIDQPWLIADFMPPALKKIFSSGDDSPKNPQ